jgi:hypothetical protein
VVAAVTQAFTRRSGTGIRLQRELEDVTDLWPGQLLCLIRGKKKKKKKKITVEHHKSYALLCFFKGTIKGLWHDSFHTRTTLSVQLTLKTDTIDRFPWGAGDETLATSAS